MSVHACKTSTDVPTGVVEMAVNDATLLIT